jgi:hypothetical protein
MKDLFILALNDSRGFEFELEYLQEIFGVDSVVSVYGSYYGKLERSYIIRGGFDQVLRVARLFNQESVLVLGNMHPILGRKAKLLFCDTKHEIDLGHMCGVSSTVAKKQDSWTYVPSQGQYYIAK